jgi:hypothetical protein
MPHPLPSLSDALVHWIHSGGQRLVQVQISALVPDGSDGWELRHIDDAALPPDALTTHGDVTQAREIAKYDAAGKFRPIKGAPSLRRGWRLVCSDPQSLVQALDFLYPAAVGNFFRSRNGETQPTHLRETLNRQTGMYRITGLLTDEQASEVVCRTCDFTTQCRRRIAFGISENLPILGLDIIKNINISEITEISSKNEMPYLCLEGCNWLVAQGRSYIKSKRAAQS